MKLVKHTNGYIVQVPDDVVAALGLHEGDDVRLVKSNVVTISASEEEREAALQTIKSLARPLPPDYKFDREEANAR